MTHTKDPRDLHDSRTHPTLTEAEISQLLKEAAKQYEEYIRLAELADISDTPPVCYPIYDWDNPIGLVVTDRTDASLV